MQNNFSMKKGIFLISLFISITICTKAQEYVNAVGVRLGPGSPAITSGFTIKHFLNESNALEGIVGIGNGGLGLCGLYEWHHPIASVTHLQWFVGAGGYVAFRNKNSAIGAAGIVGLDYKFDQIPLNISLDWKPELNLISTVGFESNTVGISARFIF